MTDVIFLPQYMYLRTIISLSFSCSPSLSLFTSIAQGLNAISDCAVELLVTTSTSCVELNFPEEMARKQACSSVVIATRVEWFIANKRYYIKWLTRYVYFIKNSKILFLNKTKFLVREELVKKTVISGCYLCVWILVIYYSVLYYSVSIFNLNLINSILDKKLSGFFSTCACR